MKRFSLSNLLLLVVIVSLLLAHGVMRRELMQARAELDIVRRRFGHIRVEDDKLTYVAQLAEPNEGTSHSWRIRVPAGSRYLLHLTDRSVGEASEKRKPFFERTISLNGWRDGADAVLSYHIYVENNAMRIRVHSETESYFDYVPTGWELGGSDESSFLQADPQKSFAIDEVIEFCSKRNADSDREVKLWLEPFTRWLPRWEAEQAEKKKTEQ